MASQDRSPGRRYRRPGPVRRLLRQYFPSLVLVLLALIAGRCIWVGIRSPEFSRRLICFGAAGALIFQTIINVGMCIGVMPVIGLTLPLISYGASSVVSIYAMLGLVSGVYARPMATSHERYIRPPMY